MNKNKKIAIGIGIVAILGFILYKKGVFGGSEGGNGGSETESETEETLKSSMPTSLPIVQVSSGSETPQVVNIPPQFGGGEVVTASNLPTSAGTWGSYNQ
jgi:hypothetical protein